MMHYLIRTSQGIMLATLLAVEIAPAVAGVALKDYAAAKNSDGFRQYLTGVANGFRQANAELQLRRVKKLYCEPQNAALGFETYTSLLEKEVKENESFYTVESPVETPLLFGLMKAYPCK